MSSLQELRRRFFWEGLIVVIFSAAALCVSLVTFHRVFKRQDDDLAAKDQLIAKSARDLEVLLAARTIELRDTAAKLKAVIDSTPVILWQLDPDGRFTLSEGSGLKQLSLKPTELVGRQLDEVFPNQPELVRGYQQALTGQTSTTKIKFGHLTYGCRQAPLRNDAEEVTGTIGVALDMTETEQATDRANAHARQIWEIIEFMPQGVVVFDEDEVVYANYEAARLMGAKDPQKLIGRSVMEAIHPDSRNIAKERLRLLALGQSVPKLVQKFVRLDGTCFDAEITSRPFFYGARPAVLSIFKDVSDQKTTDDSRRQECDRLQTIVGNAPLAIIGLNPAGRVTDWNRAAERLFGWRAKEVIGQDNPLIAKNKSGKYAGVMQRILDGQPTAGFQDRFRCADGSLILCQVWPAPIRQGGQVTGCFCLFKEVDKE